MIEAKKIQDWYKAAKTDTADWRKEARELYDMVAGRQWTAPAG
jgi:hypothetical protein